ncbi:Os07g0484900, partial [Oryza sativa Japonica Group]
RRVRDEAAGKLDGAGAFSVPLAADLRGADSVAQLHSAAKHNAACPGQEPSRIMQLSERTFVAVAGKTHCTSPVCASATICKPICQPRRRPSRRPSRTLASRRTQRRC